MNSRQLVFIISLPRSGSTLLGHFMGASRDILYSGEVPAPLHKGYPVRCRFCGETPCPIWGSVLDTEFVLRCYRSHLRAGSRFIRHAAEAWGKLRNDYEPPGALFNRIFQKCSGTKIVVDSSKHLSWINWNRRGHEFDVKYLFLLRDLRGVTASIQRTSAGSVTRIARQATSGLMRLHQYVQRLSAGCKLTVRYEDLVERPEDVGSNICDFLGVPFDSRMVEFYRHPSHVMGGNCGPVMQCQLANGRDDDLVSQFTDERQRDYYFQHPPEIRPDERWKTELTANALAEFEETAGALNRSLGYV